MAAKLSFFGAAGEVTGSTYLLDVDGARVLIDCGQRQGADAKRGDEPLPFDPSSIDAVILTHAHLDHSGRLPVLVKNGFKGKIWATAPTAELVDVLLRDSARLAAEDAAWRTRKNARRGLPPVEPPYDERDVENTLKRVACAAYDDRFEAAHGVEVRFRDAGHIVGSSMAEVWAKGEDRPVKIVFSGDIGSFGNVIERPPTEIEDADYTVIESTYGDRDHKDITTTRRELRDALADAISRGGKVLIPTFAIDRAQRLLYELSLLQQDETFPRMPKIYVDSPMGIKATQIYEKHLPMLSREILEASRAGRDPFAPIGTVYTDSAEQSRAINDDPCAIVLAGSGMCNGGRIVHHLKHNLWNEDCCVLFVGYQAIGTLGRKLVDGAKDVRIAGEDVSVRARLITLGGFSAHGGRSDLLKWASCFGKDTTFFVTHGEPKSSAALADGLRALGARAITPERASSYDLAPGGSLAPKTFAVSTRDARRDSILDMLADISSSVASVRDAADRISDVAMASSLLESARMIIENVLRLEEKN